MPSFEKTLFILVYEKYYFEKEALVSKAYIDTVFAQAVIFYWFNLCL